MSQFFKQRLLNSEILVGTILTIDAPEISEIMALAGIDWLFVDAEHSPFSTGAIQSMLQSAGRDTPCLVRVASGNEVFIKQALDIGAAGVIIPQVASREDVQRALSFSKYPPNGSRGVGVSRAHSYGLQFQEYLENANEATVVIIQIEHIDAVRDIDEILNITGVDGILIGPYDLSASMGKIGQVHDPEVVNAIEKVANACKKKGIPIGIFGLDPKAVRPYIENGFTLIVVGIDSVLLATAAKKMIKEISDIKNGRKEDL